MLMSHPAWLTAAGAALSLLATPLVARGRHAATLHLAEPWTRPTPPAAPAGAGYLTITNTGSEPDRLLGGTSPAVREVQIHQMKLMDGIMRMRPVAGGLVIPAGGSVRLAPGGYHIMLIGPKRPFVAGATVPATLRFARAGTVKVAFAVRTTAPDGTTSAEAR